MKTEIPVLLLTGYLGSGKTTLLNRILTNRKGIRFAVIVNDLGEVNIDAALIERGGVVNSSDDSLVALQNGCICCTLKMDLVEQLHQLSSMRRFDYIVIEASGICEPAPIAQTIVSYPAMGAEYNDCPTPVLDCIVTVVDAFRMQSEFNCGDELPIMNYGEDDLEKLIIEQVEFCNIIILNKISEIKASELGRIRSIIRQLQPKAKILETNFCDIDLDEIVGTGMFDFDSVATSAAWIDELENHHEDEVDDEDEHLSGDCHPPRFARGRNDEGEKDEHLSGDCHAGARNDEHEEEEHHHHNEDNSHCERNNVECGNLRSDEHHHHHHHHGEGEAEEYGITTFTYYRREPFNLNKFDNFVAKYWPNQIIRAKGICYFDDEIDKCWLFEQAGQQKSIKDAGLWYATMPQDELMEMMLRNPSMSKDWDPVFGDRMIKIVFIGQHLDKERLKELLDNC